MSVNLEKLAKQVDEALANETSESLTKWLNERRQNAKMRAEEFLEKSMTDEQFDLKLDWETAGKPTAHPFIYMLMETYAKQTNSVDTSKEECNLYDVIKSVCPKCGCNKMTGDGSKSWCLNSECDFIEAD